MDNYGEFRKRILKVHKERKHKVTGSLGVYDAYKYIRKNNWLNLPRKVTEHEFYSIVRHVNNLLAQELINGSDIKFPCKMGTLEIRKRIPKVELKEGKLIKTMPIDWEATLKLWFDDEDAFKEKILLYDESKETFRTKYNISKANYNNKSFYSFTLNRDIKVALKNKIKNKEIDAFLLW